MPEQNNYQEYIDTVDNQNENVDKNNDKIIDATEFLEYIQSKDNLIKTTELLSKSDTLSSLKEGLNSSFENKIAEIRKDPYGNPKQNAMVLQTYAVINMGAPVSIIDGDFGPITLGILKACQSKGIGEGMGINNNIINVNEKTKSIIDNYGKKTQKEAKTVVKETKEEAKPVVEKTKEDAKPVVELPELTNKEIQLDSGNTITFDDKGGIVLDTLNKGEINKSKLFSEVNNLIDTHGATINVGGENITFTESDIKKMPSYIKKSLINLIVGGNDTSMKKYHTSQVQNYLNKAPVISETQELEVSTQEVTQEKQAVGETTEKVEWQYLLLNRDKLIPTSHIGVQKMNINGDDYYVTIVKDKNHIRFGMANIRQAVAGDTGKNTVSVRMLANTDYKGKKYVISKV